MMYRMKNVLFVFILFFAFGILFMGTADVQAAVKVKKVTVKSNYGNVVHVAEGKKIKLATTVSVTPNKAANRRLLFVSSNKKVAKVTSAGYVKGVAAGTCKVKVYSALNSKKKAKISVKVVKPVTKITFESSSGSIYVGETTTLKKIIAPSTGAFKSVVWSSSNKKIATVTSAGKITGVAAGSVTIKATAVDGTGQSASYKLKVQTMDTINLESVEVLASNVIRVKLDKALALEKEQFALAGKKYEAGTFIHKFTIQKFRNYDNKIYDLTIADNFSIAEDSFVRVRISSLPGNGTKSKTAQASYIKTGMPQSKNWLYEVGDEIQEVVDLSVYATGDVSYEVTGMMDGIESHQIENTLMFTGTMTAAISGSDFLVEAVDEMGTVVTQVIHVYAGSEDVVVAAADNITMLTGIKKEQVPFAMAKGGSGQYTFVAAELPLGVTMNEDGTLSGTPVGSGEYEVTVTVIDKEDKSRVANVTATVRVADSRKIIGSVTDTEGKVVSGAAVTCTNVNNSVSYQTTSDENGTYSIFVEEGSYDIFAEFLDYRDFVYNLSVSSGGRQLDFMLD